MRTKLIVGNWKMNTTAKEAVALAESFVHNLQTRDDVDVAVCPPFTALWPVRQALSTTRVALGAQDCFWEDNGAFTGEVSVPMLVDLHVSYCIVGHSERRGRFGDPARAAKFKAHCHETDEAVNQKVMALLKYAVTPIVCVGETAEEREQGRTEEVIEEQMKGCFKGLDPVEFFGIAVAYEPVWAIGTGKACGPEEAQRVCQYIRKVIVENGDQESADATRILYGGSVDENNARELFHQPDIDGGLVGGASLKGETFARIAMKI